MGTVTTLDGRPLQTRPDIADSPVIPLGVAGGKCFVLSARGELREVSAQHLEKGNGVFELFAGGDVAGEPAMDWLATWFPSGRPPRGGLDPFAPAQLNARAVGRWLIEECTKVGLFNPKQEIRKLGVWRSADGPILNTGEALVSLAGVEPAGQVVEGVPYPAQYRGDFPPFSEIEHLRFSAKGDPTTRGMLERFRDELRAIYPWKREIDADILLGWIGCAALGAFAKWRAHLWVSGAGNTGKTTLFKMSGALLGPFIDRMLTNSTAAGIRSAGNNTARPYLFDESEAEAHPGRMAQLIEMFRHMSGAGALMQRSAAGHDVRSFSLHGAAALFSIIPESLKAQDLMRFVQIDLAPLPDLSKDPEQLRRTMARIEALQSAAAEIGERLWVHAIGRAATWDAHFETYRVLVQQLGGSSRDGDTIGAVLAGFDLLFSDLDEPDAERLDFAAEMARPLIEAARSATDEGTGERCLQRLYSSEVSLGGGEQRSVARMIIAARNGGQKRDCPYQAKLQRVGLKWLDEDKKGGPCLRIVAGEHPMLERIFQGTDFARGAHQGALKLLAGVSSQTTQTQNRRDQPTGAVDPRRICAGRS